MTGRYFSLSEDDPNGWNRRNLRDRNQLLYDKIDRPEFNFYSPTNVLLQKDVQEKSISLTENLESTETTLIENMEYSARNNSRSVSDEKQFNFSPTLSFDDDVNDTDFQIEEQQQSESDSEFNFSPTLSFDDDINDKDFQIEEQQQSESDSENHGSELDNEDFEVINKNDTDKPKINILNDIQIKKPNLFQTNASEASRLKKQKLFKKRQIMCIFCEESTDSKNFVRHLTRRHSNEKEVKEILNEPLNSAGRKQALAALRKETTFERFLSGEAMPARRDLNNIDKINNTEYYPCTFCKGLYKKSYLRRHVKLCTANTQQSQSAASVSKSQTFTACQLDQTNVISRLEVKKKVFDLMRGDDIAFAAKKDLLITYFGNSYLKKHRKEKSVYTCSNKMRELGRLLLECRKLMNNEKVEMKNLLRPCYFDTIVTAARNLAGYNLIKKTFTSPSLALHYGGNLRLLCDELYHLAVKDTNGFRFQNSNEKLVFLKDVKNMKHLIISRWNIEMSSLANKDLQEKKWNKPLLLPLVSDIKTLREETYKLVNKSVEAFKKNQDTQKDYKVLVECVLALLIIFNRRRIGDVQYMKISDYNNEQKSNFKDFEDALSATEKVLATRYRRVLNSGKGSRAVVVLIPEEIDGFIQVFLKHRQKYISEDNDYLFSLPGHKVKWGRGDIAIRNLTKHMPLENAAAITSNRLRKQIATVMQILNLSKGDIKQFSNFMGHTVKTHEEFYELPVDVYQTAKVSKMLLMIENGVPVEHKGKSLAEIDIDYKYAEEGEMKDLQNHYNENKRECISEFVEDIEKEKNESHIFNLSEKKEKREKNASNNDETALSREQEQKEEIIKTFKNKIRKKEIEEVDDNTENNNKDNLTIRHGVKIKDVKKNSVKDGPKRKGWLPTEVSLLRKRFSKYIAKNEYPCTAEIRKFLDENNILRDPVTVKSKLQHLMKLQKSKK